MIHKSLWSILVGKTWSLISLGTFTFTMSQKKIFVPQLRLLNKCSCTVSKLWIMAKFEYFLNSVKQSPNPWNLGFGTPNFFQDLFLTVMSACRLVQNWKDPEFLLLLIHNLMKISVYYNNLGPLIPMANIGASQFQFTPSGCPSRRMRRKGGPTGTQGILYRMMYWPNYPGSHLMLTVVSTLFHLKEQLQWLPPSLVLWSLLSHSSVCAQPKNSFTSRWEVFVPAPILIDFGFWEQLMD